MIMIQSIKLLQMQMAKEMFADNSITFLFLMEVAVVISQKKCYAEKAMS